MYKILILFLISAVFFHINSASAQQLKNFSTDYNSFLGEMKDLLETKDKKEGKELMEKFTLTWNGSYYGNDEKT